jgi:ACS family tartrate transporter-like MFS transporter
LYGFIGPFWSLPGQFLTGRAAAVALAAICAIGNLAGFVGLAAIGTLAGRTGGLAEGFRFIALALLLGGALLLAQRWRDTCRTTTKPLYI